MAKHRFERLERAVVHVRPCHCDVPKAWRLELALVLRIERQVVDALVARGVAAIVVEVVETVVDERFLIKRVLLVVGCLGEQEATVTVKALEGVRHARFGGASKEQGHAALLRWVERGLVPSIPAIVFRVEARELPLEGGNRLRDVAEDDGSILSRECGGKHVRVPRVISHAPKELVFHPSHAELDWLLAEHRNECLFLELVDHIVRPGQRRRVARIRDHHRVTRVNLPGGAFGLRQPVGEGEFLLMATRATLGLVCG